jgi:hypothetical protein
MTAKRVAKEVGEAGFVLLKATAAAADVFPPLKSAAGGALHIAELVRVSPSCPYVPSQISPDLTILWLEIQIERKGMG